MRIELGSRGQVASALAHTGWHPRARRVDSPNRDARPAGMLLALLVFHNISLPPGRFGGTAIEELFTNRLDPGAHPYFQKVAGLRVSAHFLVRRNGALLQFVCCTERAWHAGLSNWRGRQRCNDFSIGIEVEGTDARPYTTRQYACAARLARDLAAAFPDIAGLAGHDEIAPGRKTDPGRSFDWSRLVRESGLSPDMREL